MPGETQSEVFYASAKPETVKKPHPVVDKVKQVVSKWLDRVGPGDVEKHFVEAHQKVLGSFTSEERRKIYEKTAPRWRVAGKVLGWTATAIDAALAGFGAFVTIRGLQHPEAIRPNLQSVVEASNRNIAQGHPVRNVIDRGLVNTYSLLYGQHFTEPVPNPASSRDLGVGRGLSAAVGAATLVPAFASGPAHWLSHMVAEVAANIGKARAKTKNYVDSGKAGEHAQKIGNTFGKGLASTIHYAAEHPSEIRKTIESAQRVKHEAERHKHEVAALDAQQARIKLEQDYQDWMNSMPAGEKAYYVNSKTWPPPIEEYKRILAERAKAQKSKKR